MIDLDELDAVKQLQVPDEPSERARVDAAARLQRRIDHAHRRRAPRRRPLALAGAAAGLALTGLIAVSLAGGGSETRLVAPADAAQVLSRVAAVAAKRHDAPLRPGEYWYVQDRSRYLTTFTGRSPFSVVGATEVRETWTNRGADGRYVSRSTRQPYFLGPRDKFRWERAGRPQAKVAGYQHASGALAPYGKRRTPIRATPAGPTSTAPGTETEMTTNASGFGAGASSSTYKQLAGLPEEGLQCTTGCGSAPAGPEGLRTRRCSR